MGDFNINLLSDAPSITHYKESLESLGVISLINCSTRFLNKQTPSLLDRFTNNVISGSVTCDISDHNPVFVLSPKNKMLQNNLPWCEILKRDFSKFSEAEFLDCLENSLNNSDLGRNFLIQIQNFLNF